MGQNREFGYCSLGMCQSAHTAWSQISCMSRQDHRVKAETFNFFQLHACGYLTLYVSTVYKFILCILQLLAGKKEKERPNIIFSNYIVQKDLEKTANPPIKSIAATRLILILPFSSPVLNLQPWSWFWSISCGFSGIVTATLLWFFIWDV